MECPVCMESFSSFKNKIKDKRPVYLICCKKSICFECRSKIDPKICPFDRKPFTRIKIDFYTIDLIKSQKNHILKRISNCFKSCFGKDEKESEQFVPIIIPEFTINDLENEPQSHVWESYTFPKEDGQPDVFENVYIVDLTAQ